MIAFLSPLYLLAAAAAAVPLLIHLLRRRIGTRLEFPAVRYLARAEREHSRKLRLRNLLLMLLRVAAVLLLVLAAGRPIVRMEGSGHAPTAAAIVLDNSLSSSAISGGRPVLDRLRERARSVVRLSGLEDRLWLVTADGTVHGGGRAAVLDEIERLEPLAGAGDPSRALATAAALVGQSGLSEHEIILLTDAQRTSWPAPVTLGKARVRAWIPGGEPPPNRGVLEASAVPVRWTPRGAVHARITSPDSASYRITMEGRTLARGTTAGDEEITVRAAPPERGWTAGTVELEPDELLGDNTRWFAAWIGPAPAVRVDSSAGPFARSAIDALVHAERVLPGSGVEIAAADRVQRLPALILPPREPVRLGAANRNLERLGVPWRFGQPDREPASVGPGSDSSAAGSLSSGDDIRVSLRYPIVARGGALADTLALANGKAWLVGGDGYVIVGSPVVPEATNLPVRAAFVPWLTEIVSRSLSAEGALVSVTPGATIARPADADVLVSADGSRTAISGDSVTLPRRAGVYFFSDGTGRAGVAVANPQASESDLRRLDAQGLRALLRTTDARVTSDVREQLEMIFDSAPRREIFLPLVVLALLLLLAESVVAGATLR